jgi:hypothetical protein
MAAPTPPSAAAQSTGCWLLWLRADLPREQARDYWRGPHARRVSQVPGIDEYRQLHFSEHDHGFWRGPDDLATSTPGDWRIDGMPEVTYARTVPSPKMLLTAVRLVFRDEANAFDRVLAHLSGPNGGRWFSPPRQGPVGARAVILLRRRPGVRLAAFRSFVHEVLGGALALAPGATELRTHAFLPYSKLAWPTPGVAHDNPPHRRYHGAIVVGADDRASLDEVLAAPELERTHPAQSSHCLAVHAYAVEETVAVVQGGHAV